MNGMDALFTRRLAWFGALLAIVTFHVGCVRAESLTNDAKPYQYGVPERLNDGWETASLSGVSLDTNLIRELFVRIGDNSYKNIHSVLMVKNGKLVIEEYFPGQDSTGQHRMFTRDTLNEMHSATKSVNSILIGIAIDQHLIRSVDEKISSFFPEYSDIFTNKEKDAIRLKDLLSMTAGLSWDEWTYPYTDSRNNDAAAMASTADFFRYVLERPVATAPGTKFVYNSGISLMLGEIIYKVSGLRADKFAERYLFSPLGITNYSWGKSPNGVVNTLGGLALRPRDMAKVGCLFLSGGRWQGKQIVSEKWVKESTKRQIGASQLPTWFLADGYGYQWWLGSFHVRDQTIESYSARGRGGQFIIVFPALQMVAVFTGWNDNELLKQPLDMLQRYVLPAAMPQLPGGPNNKSQ
jgi:CubicO group peptidase (beta-lactamase class C family)